MNTRLKQRILRGAAVVLMTAVVSFQSFAASARIAFSDPSAEVGNTVDVTMKFTSTSGDNLGNTDVMLSYDANMLEYVGGSSNANGGAGAIRVTSGMEGKTEIATSLQFKALQAGSTQITIASWEGYDENGQTLTMDKEGSSAITITAPASYSTDAALASLQISPGVLTPAFSADVENYTATVGLDTEKLTVSAQASSDKATVTIDGDAALQEGENTVTCKVTAEDGTTVRDYTILVTKAEGGETAAAETEATAAASSLEVLAELESPKTPFKIGITALPEGVNAPAGLKESTITIGDTKVQGWIPNVDGQPEYCVFYGVSDAGTAGFYCYDRTDKTIQRYFLADEEQVGSAEYTDIATRYNNLVDDYSLMRMLAAGAAVLAVILLIVLIVTMSSRRKNRYDEENYEDQEEKKAPKKPVKRSSGKKLSKEERYMMGEEEEYIEPEEYSEPEEHIEPEAYTEAITVQLAQEALTSVADEPDEPVEADSYEDEEDADDFEVFDLDDDKHNM